MHATLAPRPSRKFIKGKGSRIENQQEKKDMIPTGGRKRKREGLKEGRRTAGRKKRRPSSKMLRALFHVHMLLQRVAGPKQIAHVGFKMWQRPCSLQMLVATRCKHHATLCNLQMIISRCCEYRPLAGLSFRKS